MCISQSVCAVEYTFGSTTLNFSGFLHFDAATETDPDPVKRIRPKFILENENGWGAFFEFDFAKTDFVNGENGNYVERAYITRKINSSTTVRVGRLFLGGQYNTHPPFLLKTINYWSAPYDSFAYGAQVVHDWNNGWWIVADVTGSSGKDFNESGQFDRVESSMRLKKTVSDSFSYAFGYQVSEDFTRFGADVSWIPSPKFNFFGGLYYSDEYDNITAVAITEWSPYEFFRPHVQVDRESDGNIAWTFGVGFYHTKYFRFIIDYEEKDSNVLARAQFRW